MNTTASSSSISSRSTLKSDDKNSNVTAAAPSPIFSLSSGDVRRHEPSASSPQHCHHQYTNMFVPPTLSSLHLPNLMRNRPKPNPSQSVAIKRSVPIVLIHRNASSPLSRYIKWRQLHQPQAMSTSPSASISSLTSSSSSTISSPIQTIIEQSNNSTKNNGSSSMNMDQANNMLPINRATSELSLSNLNSSITPPPIHRPRPSNNRLISKSTLPDVETLTENDNSEDEEFPVFSDLSGLSKVAKQLFPDLPASIKTSSSNLSLPLRKSPLTTPSYLTAGMDMFYDDRNPFLVMGNNSSRPAPENNQFSKQIAPPIYFEESSSESDNNKNPSNLLQSNSSSSGPPKLKQMKRTRDVIAEERWEKLPRKQKVHDSPSQRGLDFKPNNKNKISRAFIGGTDSAVGTTQKRKNREGGTNISPTDSPASTDRLRKKLNANKSPPASRNHRQQVQKQQTSSVKRRRKARSSTSSSTSSSSSSRRHSPSSQRKSRKTKDGKRKLVKRRKKTTQRLNNDDQDDSVSESTYRWRSSPLFTLTPSIYSFCQL